MDATAGAKPFLTAKWHNLALVSYAVEPRCLALVLPPGCVADTRDGSAFVSLVAFDFLDTRVFGVRWPGFTSFPEINLRAYVRLGDERGVVFIRELVPSRLIAWIARRLYNEPYQRAAMTSEVTREAGKIRVAHRFRHGGADQRLDVVAADDPVLPSASSTAHFFKEHDLGVGRRRSGELLRYRVTHPAWRTFAVESHEIDVDYGAVYGEEWAFLTDETPCSVLLAEGSEIAVYPARPLEQY